MPKSEILAKALGVVSLGLGSAQILAPGALNGLIGVRNGPASQRTMRAVGVRELAAAAGLLTQSKPSLWLWARVAGDVMDLALIAAAMSDPHNNRQRLTATMSSVAGVTAADFAAARQASQEFGHESEPGVMRLSKAITIRRSPEDVYQFWRDFRNFPTFLSHLDSVAVLDERRSHWTARGPAGRHVEWDAEIIEDEANQVIRWRSLPGSRVGNSGEVRFTAAPGDRGTEVRVQINYRPPAAELGTVIARLFGQEPTQQVQADLRKVKQVLETGEVLRSFATLSGTHVFQPAAQPPRPPASLETRS
jgi:uncharacterized membrane protein